MSGRFNGAQHKLSEMLERKIHYTRCTPHGVNLVVEHGCSVSPLISKVFAVLEKIFAFLLESPERNQNMKEKCKEVENYLELQSLSKIRWIARPESVEAIWRCPEGILSALDAIAEAGNPDAKTKAAGQINMIVNIDFICGIILLKNVIYKTKSLADYLHGETVDVASALIVMESTYDCLQRIRMADKVIEDQVLAANEVARIIGADPIADFPRLHRIRRPSRRFDDQPKTAAVGYQRIHLLPCRIF